MRWSDWSRLCLVWSSEYFLVFFCHRHFKKNILTALSNLVIRAWFGFCHKHEDEARFQRDGLIGSFLSFGLPAFHTPVQLFLIIHQNEYLTFYSKMIIENWQMCRRLWFACYGLKLEWYTGCPKKTHFQIAELKEPQDTGSITICRHRLCLEVDFFVVFLSRICRLMRPQVMPM